MDRGAKQAIVHAVTKSQHRTEVTHTYLIKHEVFNSKEYVI